MNNKKYQLMLALLFLAQFIIAHAEEINLVSEDDYIGDVQKVLTVSRLSQPLSDAPSAVTVIDRETIRASGIVDLPEIFRLVPGMYVGTNAGYIYNTNHAVSYHGMTTAFSGSMQVMINGRSVYSPLFGGVNWSELPLAITDIERIEVTRGPNAASYGANAYFGAINIITQQPSEAAGNTIIATHGNGRNEAFYRHGGELADLHYRVTVGYREDDGLDNRADFKRTRFLNAQADYQINPTNNLEFEFGLADGARGEGDFIQEAKLFLPRTKQTNNNYQLARWRHNVSEESDFSLQAYRAFHRSDVSATSVNLRPTFGRRGRFLLNDTITVEDIVETERYDIEAQHNFTLGNQIRAVWGGSVRRDTMFAPYNLGTNETDYFNLQRLFGHMEWQANNKLVLNLGAMVEHNDFTGTDTSPRASINFKPSPNHAFRVGISSALRTPSYIEEKFNRGLKFPTTIRNTTFLFQQFADKGNVNPEQIVSREIGYLGKLGEVGVDVRLFHDKISDHIRFVDVKDFVPPPGFVLLNPNINNGNAVNGGNAEIDGIETQVKWPIAKSTHVLLNYSYVHIRQTKAKLKGDFTESAPRNTLSALLTHQFSSNWDASLAYYQTSEVTALGDGTKVDLIRRCDVRLARKFNAGKWDGEVSGVVENLFDSHYQEFADYNTLKRRARVNVILNF